MGVLRDVEGVLDLVATLRRALHPGDGGVLVGAHVDDLVVALVLDGARGVELLGSLVALDEVHAWARLVAQRPDDDGGVVIVGMHHLQHARHVLRLPLGDVRERGIAVVVLVRLDVGLVLEVDTVLVAEVVPVGAGGVVRVAHVVDVGALHHHDLALHLLLGDGVA